MQYARIRLNNVNGTVFDRENQIHPQVTTA